MQCILRERFECFCLIKYNAMVTFRMYQLNFDGQEERVYKEYWKNISLISLKVIYKF